MLTRKIVIIVFMTLSGGVLCAQDMADIFDRKTSVTWLGLDFSGAKLIGDRERLGSISDVQHLVEAWNDIMLKEEEKYDVALAIDKIKVENAIEITKEHNANLDVSEMFSSEMKDHFHLKPDDIARIVADYDFKGKNGIGVMFNVESFSKLNSEAALWVTFIKMDTKEIYFSERVTGEPGGAGLRNYWANSVYNILKGMRKKEFEMWRKKYYRKY
ncbi:hypothetical protein KK083_22745 [Fulvivirgaceae bacterium PWU4]|uniref:DUF4468 domain-containing protein n=1 Tax=Chryseosolibacter histidini TaxID=2782349 RepID=A0AAP2DNR8_9BACT|nr:hypothetical protein [Chryseosolibacter histidini]MBT1699723.1 hypothetical protein [Chryseosolibacter histidini]